MESNSGSQSDEVHVNENISRVVAPRLETILGKKFPVLDDGFVRVIDYMGNDSSIVQAARVSYGQGTKKVSEDEGLIRYLMRHHHTTPFEMCELKLHVRVPMDTWRQWIRHRTASVNEYSTRYSIAINNAHKTQSDKWRLQAKSNRQGSEGFAPLDIGSLLSNAESELQKNAHDVYQQRLTMGIAREQARKDLPLSTYTEAYWKIDLHNLLHFLKLRMEKHAQEEIRGYANIIGNEIVAQWVPLTWRAFLDFQLNAIAFSAEELQLMTSLFNGALGEMKEKAKSMNWLQWDDQENKWKRNREREEFEEKVFEKFGLKVKW